LPWRALRLFPI